MLPHPVSFFGGCVRPSKAAVKKTVLGGASGQKIKPKKLMLIQDDKILAAKFAWAARFSVQKFIFALRGGKRSSCT